MTDLNILLSGVVGSTAYGLAGPDSDVDRLGVYAVPTVALHGLHQPAESHVTTAPDLTLHEAAKWCRLALSCNPTVTDLVWLPDDLYEVRTPLGDELIGIRSSLLSARRVRNAFLGYATQQFQRLEKRGDGTFSADLRKRTAKHARHLWRLAATGWELYRTGELTVAVDQNLRDHFVEFGEQVAGGDLDIARQLLAAYEKFFDTTTSPLPDRPDEAKVEAWLLRVRQAYFKPSASSSAGLDGIR